MTFREFCAANDVTDAEREQLKLMLAVFRAMKVFLELD